MIAALIFQATLARERTAERCKVSSGESRKSKCKMHLTATRLTTLVMERVEAHARYEMQYLELKLWAHLRRASENPGAAERVDPWVGESPFDGRGGFCSSGASLAYSIAAVRFISDGRLAELQRRHTTTTLDCVVSNLDLVGGFVWAVTAHVTTAVPTERPDIPPTWSARSPPDMVSRDSASGPLSGTQVRDTSG